MVYTMDIICEHLEPLIRLVKHGIIPIIQVGIPIILIVLGMLDLGKAVLAGKEDEQKKAQSMLLKRALYAVAIFFVVTIVSLLFELVSTNAGNGKDASEVSKAGNWFQCWKDY